ncbi:MAG: hypothetical protein CMF48_01995 [Legionellales bacterium]|nr:hypothetical protein [Legionellales bacterium]
MKVLNSNEIQAVSGGKEIKEEVVIGLGVGTGLAGVAFLGSVINTALVPGGYSAAGLAVSTVSLAALGTAFGICYDEYLKQESSTVEIDI